MKTYRNRKKIKRHKTLKSKVSTRQIEKDRIKNFIILAAIGVIFIIFFTGKKGLIKLIQLEIEKFKLKNEISELTKDNVRMRDEIDELQKDPKTIEKIAREELGLVKKGEIIYKFVPSQKETP